MYVCKCPRKRAFDLVLYEHLSKIEHVRMIKRSRVLIILSSKLKNIQNLEKFQGEESALGILGLVLTL